MQILSNSNYKHNTITSYLVSSKLEIRRLRYQKAQLRKETADSLHPAPKPRTMSLDQLQALQSVPSTQLAASKHLQSSRDPQHLGRKRTGFRTRSGGVD